MLYDVPLGSCWQLVCLVSHCLLVFSLAWSTGVSSVPPKKWRSRTLVGHARSIVIILVLVGSRTTLTEITEYTYINLLESRLKLSCESEYNIVPLDLTLDSSRLCEIQYITQSAVRGQQECNFAIHGRICYRLYVISSDFGQLLAVGWGSLANFIFFLK